MHKAEVSPVFMQNLPKSKRKSDQTEFYNVLFYVCSQGGIRPPPPYNQSFFFFFFTEFFFGKQVHGGCKMPESTGKTKSDQAEFYNVLFCVCSQQGDIRHN